MSTGKGVRPPVGPGGSRLGRAPGRVTPTAKPGFAPDDHPASVEPEPPRDPHLAQGERLGQGGAVLSAVRTPFVLFRFPGIMFAIFTAALILGVATAASPLFLSSASTAAIRQVTAGAKGIPALSLSTYNTIDEDVADFRDQKLAALTSRTSQLGPPVETVVGGRQTVTNPLAPKASAPEVVLATRTDAEHHLQFVDGGPGDGLWIADSVARPLSIEVGDRVRVGSQPGASAKVAGIYKTLAQLPREDYWAPVAGLVYPINPNAPAPPPLLLAPKHLFYDMERTLADQGQFRWEFPLRDVELTLPVAQRLSNGIAEIIASVNDPTSEVGFGLPAAGVGLRRCPTW